MRRPSDNRVQYKVGDVIRHKRYHYRGVIYGWDAECKAEEDWMLQMRIDQLPGELQHLSPRQPGYSSLPWRSCHEYCVHSTVSNHPVYLLAQFQRVVL